MKIPSSNNKKRSATMTCMTNTTPFPKWILFQLSHKWTLPPSSSSLNLRPPDSKTYLKSLLFLMLCLKLKMPKAKSIQEKSCPRIWRIFLNTSSVNLQSGARRESKRWPIKSTNHVSEYTSGYTTNNGRWRQVALHLLMVPRKLLWTISHAREDNLLKSAQMWTSQNE